MKKIFSAILLLLTAFSAQSQNIAINETGNQPDTSAMLDISSTTRGFLAPRMTKAQRNAIALPATGLMVFQTGPDSTGFHYYNGTQWLWLVTSDVKSAWALTGNNGTDSTINFLGTTDDKPIMLRQNNLQMGQLNTKMHNYFVGGGSGADNTATQNTGFGDSALNKNTTGQSNTAIGYRAMKGSTAITGSLNTAVGSNAMAAVTTGFKNVAIGESSLSAVTDGRRNVAVGDSAMATSNGSDNIAIGYKALSKSGNTVWHVAVGSKALTNSAATYPNTAIGYSSQDSNSTGAANTTLGSFTLSKNTTGVNNTAIGNAAMYEASNAINGAYVTDNTAMGNDALRLVRYYGETAIGAGALRNDTGSIYNTSVGFMSMYNHLRGSYNTALGTSALGKDSTGAYNTAIGMNTMYYHKTGDHNTAVGTNALLQDSISQGNIAVGSHAMYNHKKNNYNTAVGYESMYYENNGVANTAVGYRSFRYTKDGVDNTAIGTGALEYTDSSMYNVAVGRGAMMGKGGNLNTAVGYFSSGANANIPTPGTYVTEATTVGAWSGYKNMGNMNTFIGASAGYGAGPDSLRGIENTGVGAYTLYTTTTGKGNSTLGIASLYSNTTGSNNVAIGCSTLTKNTVGGGHVAIGSYALRKSTATYANTAIGYSSQDSATTGVANTSIGTYSLTKNTGGYNNTAIGNAAMYEAENKSNPLLMFDNTAMGNDALRLARYSGETAIGAGALRNDTGSYYNTAIGYLTMYNHLRGDNNVSVGTNALRQDTTGAGNTAIGMNSLYTHKTGNDNTAVGLNALNKDANSNINVALGAYSMFNHTKNDGNSAVGNEAMYFDVAGSWNTAMGWRSLRYAKNPSENTAVGVGALELTDSSMYNVAIGRGAMMGKGGRYNTALGYYASGYNNGFPSTNNHYTTGTTSIGYLAGYRNFGNDNTFVGIASGQGAAADSLSGTENTGLGAYSLTYNSTGTKNTAIGHNALNANQSGSSNTAIGYNTATATNNLSNTTTVGANAYAAQSNSMILGSISGVNGAIADTKVGIGTTTPDSTFSVADKFTVGNSGTVQYDNSVSVMNYMFKTGGSNANRMIFAHSPSFSNYGLQYQDAGDKFNFIGGSNNTMTVDLINNRIGLGTSTPAYQLQLTTDAAAKLTTSTWTTTSDIRLKTIDGNYTKGLKEILQLNTIMYHYAKGNARNLNSDVQAYGFSAQEVQKVFPEAVTEEQDGYLSLNIHTILIAYVNAIKEQQQQIEELKKKAEEKSKDEVIEKLLKRIEALEAKTATIK